MTTKRDGNLDSAPSPKHLSEENASRRRSQKKTSPSGARDQKTVIRSKAPTEGLVTTPAEAQPVLASAPTVKKPRKRGRSVALAPANLDSSRLLLGDKHGEQMPPILPVPDAGVSEHEKIALLAYSFWEARGRQEGNPDEDWFRAEREIRARSTAAGPAGKA